MKTRACGRWRRWPWARHAWFAWRIGCGRCCVTATPMSRVRRSLRSSGAGTRWTGLLSRTCSNATPLQFKLFELQAAEAMIKLGDQQQRPVVRAALFPSSDQELEQVALACQILGEVRDRESIHQLISLSEYQEELLIEVPQGETKVTKRIKGKGYPPEVQLAIAGALSAMGHGDGTFVADRYAGHTSELVRSQAAYVYGQIGRLENWGKLDALMGDSYGGVRVAAAAAVLKSAAKARLTQ
jgi:HEAT repeat protein